MTEQDGTQGITGETLKGSQLDTICLYHGDTLPGGSNDVPQNGIFLLETLDGSNKKGIYEQTNATKSTPTWVLRLSEAGDIFGSGEDGDATNPAAPTQDPTIVQYNDLTFTTNTTWSSMPSPMLILVKGTLTIDPAITWTINALGGIGGLGSIPTFTQPGDGGNGSAGNATVIIVAKTVVAGAGSIIAATATGNGITGGAGLSGPNQISSSPAAFGSQDVYHLGGLMRILAGGGGGPTAFNSAGAGGNYVGISSPISYIRSFSQLISVHGIGGGGGSGGSSFTTGGAADGGGGGSGGESPFAAGGAGGAGANQGTGAAQNSSGGGGGGGAQATIILVTDNMDSDLEITATGTTGGAGGAGFNSGSGGGGGGGGGAAACVLFAPSDSGTRTPTGGAGGAGGAGPGVAGSAGSTGGTASIFVDIDKFLRTH